MSKSDLFEFYEIMALVLPGAVFLYGVSKLFPQLGLFSFSNNFSAGELGVFVLIAYTVGHMVQVFGTVCIEKVWRYLRGEPTEWVRTGKKQLFSPYQIEMLETQIPERLGLPRNDFHLGNLTRKQWLTMHKQMYVTVIASGNGKRLEKFQAIYTMCRGLIATLVILAILSLFNFSSTYWYLPSFFLAFAGVLFYRMGQFERHAVHELFIQFLQPPQKEKE